MPLPARAARSIPELLAPLPLAVLAALALNDHVAKAAWPGPVTGKLSDVAGCFVLPLVVSAVLAQATRWPLRLRLGVGAAATTALLTALKLSPAAAGAVAGALGAVQRLARAGESRIVADPTDLIALPAVGLAVWYGLRRGQRPPRGDGRRVLRAGVLGTAIAILAATSLLPRPPRAAALLAGPLTYRAETSCGASREVVLRVERGDAERPAWKVELDGGARAGIAEHGRSYGAWIDLSRDLSPEFGLANEGRVMQRCTLEVEREAERLPIRCETYDFAPRLRTLGECRGVLVRAAGPPAP